MQSKIIIFPFQECLLGRAEGCDIRIQLPIVSKEHAKLRVKVQDNSVCLLDHNYL